MEEKIESGGKKGFNVLFAVILGVILLLAAFLLGYALAMRPGLFTGGGLVAGCDESALVQRLKDAGYLPPDLTTDEPVRSLTGKITTVGADYFDVTASLTPIDAPATYRVRIGADTKVVLRTAKDAEQMNEEMAAFELAMAALDPATEAPPEPPVSYVERTATVSDLRQDMTVSVKSGLDMRVNSTFLATEVSAREAAIAAAPEAVAPPVEEPPVAVPPVEEPPVEEPPAELPPVEAPPVE